MSKVKIKYKLDDIEKELFGILNKKLNFKDDDYLTNIIILENEIIMEKENDEIYSKWIFGNSGTCDYCLKKYNKKLSLNIDIKKCKISNNSFEIVYIIEGEKKIFRLEYELI